MTIHHPHRPLRPRRGHRPAPGLAVVAGAVLAALVALALPAAAQEAAKTREEKPPAGVDGRLATIDAKLDRIAVALEAQQEMAQLELMLRRVESTERRIDGLETSRVQARTYLGTLAEKRIAAEGLLAETRDTVRSGWPTAPRGELLRQQKDAEENLERLGEEIEGIQALVAQIEARIGDLRRDAAEWSAMLETRLARVTSGLSSSASGSTATAAADE